jgi:predicted aspartyl protease
MGTFRQRVEIATTPQGPFEEMEALVDTCATYTQAPASLLHSLGVDAIDSETFVLADGSQVERRVGEITLRLDGRTRTTLIVFDQEGATPLLGAVTLEEFGLRIDPLAWTLVPVPGYLVGFRRRRAA